MKKKTLLIFLIFLGLLPVSYGQGCSDAGFCTLNSIKTGNNDSTELKSEAAGGFNIGQGDFSIMVATSYLEYQRKLSSKISITGKITYVNSIGNIANTDGLGDVFLSGSVKLSSKFKFITGFKIPLSDGNKNSLPMNYQPSLGTFDWIGGINFQHQNFALSSAIQLPITQNNNQFSAEKYPLESPLRIYQSTNQFIRKPDVLVRASYSLKLMNEKLQVIPGILPIFHLGEDQFEDSIGVNRSIKGSSGLTLNGTFQIMYLLNKKNIIELSFGSPFIARKSRPDGLTRKYVLGLEYRIKF